MKKTATSLILALLVVCIVGDYVASACTIGVADGVVTVDGRPLLWKSRKWLSSGDNLVVYVNGAVYDYIGIKSNNGTYAMMGLNEAGLSTGNSLVGAGGSNGLFMDYVLQNFATVEDVREYIAAQYEAGTLEAQGCFPFMDALGNATMFEINRSVSVIEYYTLNELRADQGMYGWVVRANEFHQNEDGTDDPNTPGRYHTGTYNIGGLIDLDLLSAGTIMHGNDGADGFEFMRYGPGRPLPTIAEYGVCSSMAVHGVSSGEAPVLSTMWAALGHPNYAIAVPTWFAVSDIPACLNNGDMAALANSLYSTGNEVETQASVFPVEEHLFAEVAELMARWRVSAALQAAHMERVETQMANDAYSLLYCLDQVQFDNMAPTVEIRSLGAARRYVWFSGHDVAIDNLDVQLGAYHYADDFSTPKAEKDSYDHSVFWPEQAFPPPKPYLFFTHVMKPPEALAFAEYKGQSAHLAYEFPIASSEAAPASWGTLQLDVSDLGDGYASYSLSTDGEVWTLPMPLGFGHVKIPLGLPGTYIRHFEAAADDVDGTIESYLWDFGDGDTAAGRSVWHTFDTCGWHLISCTVTDDDGVSVTDWRYYYISCFWPSTEHWAEAFDE